MEKRQEKMAQRYAAVPQPGLFGALPLPVYHVSAFTHPHWPVITSREPHLIQSYRWGLIPFFMKNLETAMKLWNQTANCIGEEAFSKPSFRGPIKSQRCLVPVTGFFEWRHEGKNKYPHYITHKTNEIMSLAGVYDHWSNPATGEIFNTFSIVTCRANKLMSFIHNSRERMPLILPQANEKLWLDNSLTAPDVLQLISEYPEDELKAHTISKLISSRTANNYCGEVLDEYDYPEMEKYKPGSED